MDAHLVSEGDADPRTLAGLLAERPSPAVPTGDVPREVSISVVGTGRDPSLDRLVDYLSTQYGIPIRTISFGVFKLPSGDRVLLRELADTENASRAVNPPAAMSIEMALAAASQAGIGSEVLTIHQAATAAGLFARVYKTSIMYTPPSRHTRCLFTVWTYANKMGNLWIYVAEEAIEEFWPPLNEAAARTRR